MFWGRRSTKTGVAKSEKSTFSHPRLGIVTLNVSSRARRISIAISREGAVKLTLPDSSFRAQGLKFLDEKAEWIAAKQQQAREQNRAAQKTIEPPFSTKFHALRFEPAAENTSPKARITEDEIIVSIPSGQSHSDPEIQALITQSIDIACRKEAQEYLPTRVEQLAAYARRIEPRYKWKTGAVTARKARTRWGSCAANNNISLNIALMLLPDRLIDYVILHELTHTVHKDHSSRFHALLDKLVHGAHADLRRELKNFSPLAPPSSHHQ